VEGKFLTLKLAFPSFFAPKTRIFFTLKKTFTHVDKYTFRIGETIVSSGLFDLDEVKYV